MADPPIPAAALENHIAFLGKTGSGKSNAAKTVVERLLDVEERVCIIDPTGTWYGLRLTRARKPSPYKVTIFGGLHGDLAIGGAHGAAIAEVVATSSTSAIIDTRSMTVRDRTRFFADFAETLLRTNRGILTLVIDEAQLFAPKGKIADPSAGLMLAATNNLLGLGRGVGLRIILLSQRPAKVHNDCLGSVETLVAMRMLLPHDRVAVMEWVKEQADPDQAREILASLPLLPTGDAWIWSPGLDLLERRHFPLARTFDSGRPVPAGESGPQLAPLDIRAITARLDQVAADVVANDPKALRAEIARLKAAPPAAAAKPIDASAEQIAVAEERGFNRGVEHGKLLEWRRWSTLASERIDAALAGLMASFEEDRRQAEDAAPPPAFKSRPKKADALHPAMPSPVVDKAGDAGAGAVAPSLTPSQLHLLKSLAWWSAMGHGRPTRTQVAAIAGWTPKGSNLRGRLAELSAAGLIEYPQTGLVSLTDAGRAIAPALDRSLKLREAISAALTPSQRTLFETLLVMDWSVPRDELAAAVGWEPKGSNLRGRLAELSALEIVTYPSTGLVRLQDWAKG